MISLFLLLITNSVRGSLFGLGPIDLGSPLTTDLNGVTLLDRTFILQKHNDFRASVTTNIGSSASDLAKLKWDDNLEKKAQSWAVQCPTTQEDVAGRSIPEYGVFIGQNVFQENAFTISWTRAFNEWIGEGSKFRYGENATTYLSAGETIMNYVQIVSNATTRIGCGFARCGITTIVNHYVCNYAIGAEEESSTYPFADGTRCSACPGNCIGNLCAKGCEGKLCRNGGTLDFNTCACQCPNLYSGSECEIRCGGTVCQNGGVVNMDTCTCQCPAIYTGSVCETLACPANDQDMCATFYNSSYCSKGSHFKYKCPYMCGVCTGDYGTFVSKTTPSCTYTGVRPSAEKCSTLGHQGYDTYRCASNNGDLDCTGCSSSDVRDLCPVMCGLCEEPKCSYVGDKPTSADCQGYGNSGKDYQLCEYIECSMCETFRQSFCPQKCGLCL